jgi:hypothetical protein
MKDLIAGLALVGGAVALGRSRGGLSGLGYSNEEHVVRGEAALEEAEYYIQSAGIDSVGAVSALMKLTEAWVNFSAARDPRSYSVMDKENEVAKIIRQRLESCR